MRPESSLRRHHLTQAEYDALVARQDGACPGCFRGPADDLDIDHDHKTGRVRGLLCHDCNSLVGAARDQGMRLLYLGCYLLGLDLADVVVAGPEVAAVIRTARREGIRQRKLALEELQKKNRRGDP